MARRQRASDARKRLAAVAGSVQASDPLVEEVLAGADPDPATADPQTPELPDSDIIAKPGTPPDLIPADKTADKSFDKTADKPSDKVSDKTTDKVSDKPDQVERTAPPQLAPLPSPPPQPAQPPAAPEAGPDALDLPDPTGIDIPPDLHERVQKAAASQRIGQTDVLLMAYETVHDQIGRLVAEHKARNTVSSPLFGPRAVRAAEPVATMRRLQIRPTARQHRVLRGLAEQHGVPLAVLTRLVLKAFLGRGKRGGGAG